MWSPQGHYFFNKIHLKALSQIGDVYTVFREAYFNFDCPHVTPYLKIPERFYVKKSGYYFTRIKLAVMVRWVWTRISSEKWDYIILSSYDPMAVFISQCFKDSIVIDHNTLGLLNSRIDGFLLRHLSKRIKHIVFNDAMKNRMLECGINNVSIVPHGFIPMNMEELTIEEENELLQRFFLDKTDKIIFLPSLSMVKDDVVGQYIYNSDFNEFLKQHGLKLLTKSNVKRVSMSNIIIINCYLSETDYKYLFIHSSCNVILYSPDFIYRSSGVLNECFANNIPCVISDCPGLKEYLPYFSNEYCVFRDTAELKKSIISVVEKKSNEYYRNLDDIRNPQKAWGNIIR